VRCESVHSHENAIYLYTVTDISMVIFVSRRAVDALFQSLYLLTDIRAILRETAPTHELDAIRKEHAGTLLAKLKKQVLILEEELVP
jgi:hypothetical protein